MKLIKNNADEGRNNKMVLVALADKKTIRIHKKDENKHIHEFFQNSVYNQIKIRLRNFLKNSIRVSSIPVCCVNQLHNNLKI